LFAPSLTRAPASRRGAATAIGRGASPATAQVRFLAGGALLAFALPFVLTDLVAIDRDLYYGIYAGAVFTLFWLWLRRAGRPVRQVLSRNWRAAFALAVLFGGVMVAVALKEAATSRPHGWAFAGALVWRGVVYGLADGLLLSTFPILVVFAAFGAQRTKRALFGIGTLALAASLAFTAVYHLGYADFRGSKLRKPVAGDVIWSAPTLLTLNPIGAPLAHAALHVTAVAHSYDTDIFLPPHAVRR
jgi:hypothetical protein